MNRPVDPVLHAAAALAWPERNQCWLSTRFAWWRERIEHGAAETATALPPDEGDFEPAAVRLAALFGLSMFETELVLLAAGVEINTPLREAVARTQGTTATSVVRLRFSLALSLSSQAHWDALSPLGPLRHWSLLHFDSNDGITQTLLRIDERVLHYLTGTAAFDERLQGIARLNVGEVLEDERAQQIANSLGGLHEPLVMLPNALHDAAYKRASRSLVDAVFRYVGLRTLWVDSTALLGDAHELVDIARRVDREAALIGTGVALAADADAPSNGVLIRFIAALRSPLIVLGTLSPMQLADLPQRQLLRFSVPTPQAAASAEMSPLLRRCAARALQQFNVEPVLLDQALASVAGLADETAIDTALWGALRESARGGLDTLAQRIESRASFDDLVVPPFVAAQLREIASQLRYRQRVYDDWGFGERHSRGLGIAALFAGESGTGKTLAAEAIANEARLDLYRVDLASTVSKYIGETEKNLAKLFDAAQRSGAVLLFDEADALFGKRSEVKDSHDRYANIEVAYLLQRIETYRGLAILTSNLKSALDRAFLRRIRFVVQFPFPDEGAREQIWRRQFPPRAPLGDIDYGTLARLQLSGGYIRSVALNAAFAAAGHDVPLAQPALMTAARAEFAKLERSFNAPTGGAA